MNHRVLNLGAGTQNSVISPDDEIDRLWDESEINGPFTHEANGIIRDAGQDTLRVYGREPDLVRLPCAALVAALLNREWERRKERK